MTRVSALLHVRLDEVELLLARVDVVGDVLERHGQVRARLHVGLLTGAAGRGFSCAVLK